MPRMLTMVAAASIALLGLGCAPSAEARVYLSSTRIIFPAEKREVSTRVINEGSSPSLMQAWISEHGTDSSPMTASVPFIIRPPIFRLDGGRSQVMRIQHAGAPLPQDRESLFWLNIREVPAKVPADGDVSNSIQLVVTKKVKLLYRPKGLRSSDAGDAAGKLQWSVVRSGQEWELHASNTSPYFVNVNSISVDDGKIDVGTGAVPPLGMAKYQLSHAQRLALGQAITFEYINDSGGVQSITLPLSTR